MNILVLNSGSSSLKYKMYTVNETVDVRATGMVDRIGLKKASISLEVPGRENHIVETKITGHKTALEFLIGLLTDPEHGIIASLSAINGIGHRVVHGAEKFSKSVLINDEVIDAIKECCDLAPLHNPPNLIGIYACNELLPDVPQVAVFDTAFHQTMPKKAYLYGLPYEQYEKYGIRRYGFHGTSHFYVARKTAKILDTDITALKIITCHLGNGCSITAVDSGKSVDTSMGLTPLEGVMMGTRCGDIDPFIPLYILEKAHTTLDELNTLLNKESGLLGISGKRDMRDVLESAEAEDTQASIAIDMFAYRIAKYIGAYVTAMNGTDAIVFTAGIGQNSSFIRTKILSYFTYLGIAIDGTKNKKNELIISSDQSKIAVLVVPTDEELVIAQDTHSVITRQSS